jgi:DNA-binding phage protein
LFVHDIFLQSVLVRTGALAQHRCMPAMDDHDEVYARALARAAARAGGTAQLAKRLGVTLSDVEHWLHGQGTPDMDVFMRIVAIALGEETGSS